MQEVVEDVLGHVARVEVAVPTAAVVGEKHGGGLGQPQVGRDGEVRELVGTLRHAPLASPGSGPPRPAGRGRPCGSADIGSPGSRTRDSRRSPRSRGCRPRWLRRSWCSGRQGRCAGSPRSWYPSLRGRGRRTRSFGRRTRRAGARAPPGRGRVLRRGSRCSRTASCPGGRARRRRCRTAARSAGTLRRGGRSGSSRCAPESRCVRMSCRLRKRTSKLRGFPPRSQRLMSARPVRCSKSRALAVWSFDPVVAEGQPAAGAEEGRARLGRQVRLRREEPRRRGDARGRLRVRRRPPPRPRAWEPAPSLRAHDHHGSPARSVRFSLTTRQDADWSARKTTSSSPIVSAPWTTFR